MITPSQGNPPLGSKNSGGTWELPLERPIGNINLLPFPPAIGFSFGHANHRSGAFGDLMEEREPFGNLKVKVKDANETQKYNVGKH